MTYTVGVIVLCYNGIELTLECIHSLLNQEYSAYQIYVVDNASTDGTVEIIRSRFPQIRIISTGANLGYCAGNNAGMALALKDHSDLVFLVNNDTRLDPGCISALVAALADHPQSGAIGPMVYTWDNRQCISSAGGKIDWLHADAINEGAGEMDHGQFPRRKVDYINGCGIMVTKTAVERAGMLDASYFMYWEETDWCQRIKRAGFDLWFEPAAKMEHKAPIVSGELGPATIYYMTRNRIRFFARHAPWRIKLLTLAHAVNGAVRGLRSDRQKGRLVHARATQMALQHAFTRRWGFTDPSRWLIKSPKV
jgi:hypothetical protein